MTEESMSSSAPAGGAKWGIALIIGVLLLGGWALFGRNGGSSVDMGGSGDTIQGSLKELIALGGNRTCTYTITTPDGDMEGVVYTAGGSSRSDVTFTSSEGAMTMHSITDSEYMYSWSDAMAFGVKMRLSDVENASADTSADASAGNKADAYTQSVDFDCKNWSADASVFAPPTSVDFQDMSDMMQQMQQMQGQQ